MKDSQSDEMLTESITFRCSPTLKEFILKAAKAEGRRPSQWIVWKIQGILDAQGKAENDAEKEEPPETNFSFSHERSSGEASLAAS